ncbi:MAG: hypothetical protein IJ471_01425 [Eubacterium sp.]|nr:hypothetical protein [Eubacterium sp.]
MADVVYMKVTTDKFELPVMVANTVAELAIMDNTTSNNIRSAICKREKGLYKSKYVKVILDNDEGEPK